MIKRTIPILLAVMALAFVSFAQQQKAQNDYTINWKGIQKYKFNPTVESSFLHFDGAISDPSRANLPVFVVQLPVSSALNVNYLLKDAVYIPLEAEEKALISETFLSSEAQVSTEIAMVKKKTIAIVRIFPFRKSSSGQIERLSSFNLKPEYHPLTQKVQLNLKRSYANNSVLSSGTWYKFAVSSSGVHRITYSDLENWGVPVASLDPRNISIHGNGGGMLPEKNSDFVYDDLYENAIFIYGENDGSFDQGDYILFYAQGPNTWKFDTNERRFKHTLNKYSTRACYFLTVGSQTGKRISSVASSSQTPTVTVNNFDDYAYHEKDSLNLIKSGREWYGEVFDILLTHNFSFSFPNISNAHPVKVRTHVLARATSTSSFTINAAGNYRTVSVPSIATSYNSDYARGIVDTSSFSTSNSTVTVSLKYNKPNSNAIGWLNFIELNAVRGLNMSGGQMNFRKVAIDGPLEYANYQLTGANSSVIIWDVTRAVEPKKILGNLNGSTLDFTVEQDTLREFVAFNGSAYYSTTYLGTVSNQNLHALGPRDMVIVSHRNFLSQANQVADLHRTKDNLDVEVVELQQIYNEFSSGVQDPSAIKNFMKMFYDRASSPEEMPRYLLLFGDGSYDPQSRIPDNTNYIVTYQSLQSLQPVASYVTDDYFGLLDDNEGLYCNGHLDIGIGRFPVRNTEEAAEVVDKIMRYVTNTNMVDPNSSGGCVNYTSSISSFGDWRNTICFVADDEDNNLHIIQAEQLAYMVDTAENEYNINKIYVDSYVQESTSGGQRYPDVNEAINQQVNKGCLIMNYTGHGGEVGWGHERYLQVSDINGWTNKNNLAVFLTATCEFSRFDDPERTSAGEMVLLNPNGGAVSMFTTTRLAFSNSNFTLNRSFLSNAFDKVNGEFLKMGDIIRTAKVANGSNTNIRNFVLLGDPALRLAYPEYHVVTTQVPDTVRALEKVTISGNIQDDMGSVLANFNGIIYPTVYDKATETTTRGNDPASSPMNYRVQKNILYKGKVSVINGEFTFSFVVPKDIAYQYGIGRISYYADNGETDANGFYESFVIGGSSSNIVADNSGPEIDLYLNDETFVFGGITDENPMLLAFVMDSNGVNTVGNGIGHDIVAVLDEHTEKAIVLNEYYESDLNTYQSGSIRYPFSDLDEGTHTLRLKVWDVYNNSSEAYTEFVVALSEEMALEHVLNYPNPFTTQTYFMFEHNQPCCDLDVQIQIFSIGGRLVKTIDRVVQTNGYRIEPISWNGTDDYGDLLAKGVYIYKVRVRNKDGSITQKTEKLVILK